VIGMMKSSSKKMEDVANREKIISTKLQNLATFNIIARRFIILLVL
jgi:hypothetical protein